MMRPPPLTEDVEDADEAAAPGARAQHVVAPPDEPREEALVDGLCQCIAGDEGLQRREEHIIMDGVMVPAGMPPKRLARVASSQLLLLTMTMPARGGRCSLTCFADRLTSYALRRPLTFTRRRTSFVGRPGAPAVRLPVGK